MTILEINKAAIDLGIEMTNADLDTDMCNAWIDRVTLPKMYFDGDEKALCQRAIDDANRYAI